MTTAHTKKNVKRKKVANQIINRRMLYAAGLGLIPIPIVDAAGILGIQVVMIKDMASLYRVPFKEHVFKSLIGSMLGSVGTFGAIKTIPGLGTILGGATVSMSAAASTYAVGNVFMQHFAQGGTLLDFDPVKSRIYFQDFYEEGARKAQTMSVERLKKSSKKIGLAINPTKNTNGSDAVSSTATGSAIENVAKGKREDPALAKSKRIKELKAKRRKLVKAKKRKSYIRKTIGKVFSVSLLCLLAWQFYFKNLFDNSSMSTEIDLYMKEAKAKKFQLPATGDLDSLSNLQITNFAPNSTEYVIARYIESPDATYPKRYALSAVRFTGSSESLSCLLYTSPSPRDATLSRMPSSA